MALFDTTPRALGGKCGPRWRASRESHPSEDLSELPPLLVAVAGQEYHYQIADEGRIGLSRSPIAMRDSPPQAVLWTDGYRSAPYLAVFYAVHARTGGLGASSNVAVDPLPGILSSVDVSTLPDIQFSRNTESKRTPSLYTGNK